MEKLLSQPFSVAEVSTKIPGKYVTLKDNRVGFHTVIDSMLDSLQEGAFYMVDLF